jgi:hypothetical protein
VSKSNPRCAVIFKAYAWDPFVERQANRLAEAAGSLDFFVQIDVTNKKPGRVPFDRVERFTCEELEATGLAPRFGIGGVLWWNPDYAHYHFLMQHPDYDYYLFVEYDVVVQGSLEEFVRSAIAKQADLVALPISRPFKEWHWMTYQRDVYPDKDVRLALLNVCFLSKAALKYLHERRLLMADDSTLHGWPSSEVFLPSEILRAGMNWVLLSEFGDVANYDWFPPMMEEDLLPSEGPRFLHPVLDRARYLSSMLHNTGSLKPGELDRALSRFRREEYANLIWPAARQRAVRRIRHKLIRLRHQWGF